VVLKDLPILWAE